MNLPNKESMLMVMSLLVLVLAILLISQTKMNSIPQDVSQNSQQEEKEVKNTVQNGSIIEPVSIFVDQEFSTLPKRVSYDYMEMGEQPQDETACCQPIDDWKEYTNGIFSIRYPSDYEVIENFPDSPVFSSYKGKLFIGKENTQEGAYEPMYRTLIQLVPPVFVPSCAYNCMFDTTEIDRLLNIPSLPRWGYFFQQIDGSPGNAYGQYETFIDRIPSLHLWNTGKSGGEGYPQHVNSVLMRVNDNYLQGFIGTTIDQEEFQTINTMYSTIQFFDSKDVN